MATAMTSPPAAAPEVAAAASIVDDSSAHATDLTAQADADHHATDEAMAERRTDEVPDNHEHNASDGQQLHQEAAPTIADEPEATAEPSIPNLGGEDMSAALPSMAALAHMDLNAIGAYEQIHTETDPVIDVPLPLTPKNAPMVPFSNSLMTVAAPPFDTSPYVHNIDETRISAYAKLEFEDGEFYMNTYSVILGRDLAAARASLRREAEQKEAAEQETREPKTPVRIKGEESRYTRSVVSESGGILREGDDSDSDDVRRRKHRKASKKSKSTGSSSQRVSRRNSLVQPDRPFDYQPQLPSRHPETIGAVPVDPASLRPSPNDCPFVGIHPPAATGASGFKAISRQHVKIAYNSKRHLFEAEVIGRNGAFVDDQFHFHDEIVPLKSGSRLQIGGVVVRFVLPDVAIGETGAEQEDFDETATERYSTGGKEMSFDFEEEPREGALMQDTSEESDKAIIEEGPEEDEEEDIESEASESVEVEPQPPSPQLPPKRRGPGRPPKNGIMSKREERLLKKEREAQERAKKALTDPPLVVKNKVGRPRKHPLPDTPPKTEKRKYTKRKPKDPDGINQEGSDDERREKKEKKSTRAERSPTPTFNEADLTPEQLAKPQANYVTLIYEALSSSKTGSMSLPQIYRAIQRKYPFFVLRCNTNGWQSSVRHNLSQHHAFRKVQRDGKGWTWGIVEGVSIEKEKKRRATPPPPMVPGPHQPIYRTGPYQHMMPVPPGPIATDAHAVQLQQDPRYAVPNYPVHRPSIPAAPAAPTLPPGSYSSPYGPKPGANTASHSANPSLVEVVQPMTTIPRQPAPPPPSNDHVSRAIEAFKSSLIAPLRAKTADAEAIVHSAVDRVLGRNAHSRVPGNPHEDAIIAALRGILSKIPGSHIAAHVPAQPPPPTQAAPQPLTAPLKSTAPTMQRPSFMMGSNRPNLNVPRPPMMTPGMGKTSTGSPAQSRPSEPASPAPVGNGAQTDNGQTSGTKRPLEEPAEMGDFKRVSTGSALKI